MAEATPSPTPAPIPSAVNPTPIEASKPQRQPKVDDAVVLVGAYGEKIPAKVTAVHDGGRIDLKVAEYEGNKDEGTAKDLVVTKSPHDKTGKRADSWHFA